jgi:ubiquitin C-terminal hydrolase
MFGLNNFRGSCWVNTCLQAIFRIPEVQERYNSETFDKKSIIDECLCKIWKSKGEEGLKDFFAAVRTKVMPAGNGIGDSHELINYLCDKLPFLDELVRFKIAYSITCSNCGDKQLKEDTVNEFSISTHERHKPMIDCIGDTVKENVIEDRECEKCKVRGPAKQQQLIGSFPKVMIFHMISPDGSIDYSSILALNKRQYALLSVSCFNGGHWWGYGRDMPPGSSWYTLNDRQVSEHGPKQFPISNKMKILIYYRIEN